jgi:type VI secretion system Hcp family effector
MSQQELRRALSGRGAKIAIPTVAAVGAGGAIAVAAGGPGDTIDACYRTKGGGKGTLRIADSCRKGERAISWNRVGPRGPAGAPGPAGAKGDTGATGPAGAPGAAGPQGAKGDTGATGSQGPAGPTGPQGPQGPAGSLPMAPACDDLSTGDPPAAGNPDADVYLDIPGAPGDVTAKAHANEIAVRSFCFTGAPPAGAAPGAERFGTFTIEKRFDRSSPALLQNMVASKAALSGTFSFERMTAKGVMEEFLTYKFTDLHVTGYRHGGHGDALTDDVSFSWGQVAVAYQGPAGPSGFTYVNPDAARAEAEPACADLRDENAATGGVVGYLDMPSAPGDSTSKAHPGDVELRSFCLAGTGGSTGAAFGSFTVEKLYDRSTPVLLDHMTDAKGTLGSASVILSRPLPAGGVEDFVTYKFDGVRVDGYRQGGHGDPLGEDVSFDWEQVHLDYRPGTAGDTWSFDRRP